MIHSRSTYNKEYNWIPQGEVEPSPRVVVSIKIWKGDFNNPPTDVTYKMEVINPLGSTGAFKVNISDFVQEFIQNDLITYDFNTDVYVDNNKSSVWVMTSTEYEINGVLTSVGLDEVELGTKAYVYSDEVSFDFEPLNRVMSSFSKSVVSRNSVFVLPLIGSLSYSVVSLPNNTINISDSISTDLNSENRINRLVITNLNECYLAGDTEIQVSIDNSLAHTITIKNEKKYNPFDVFFINRFGQLENLTFFRESIESIKTEKEEYERSNGLAVNGLHQFVNYNLNSRTSFKANTGYLKEVYNEKIKQLMLSDAHWIFKDGKFLPVNLTSSSQEYKTRQKDRLINYEFEFSYSFNDINIL